MREGSYLSCVMNGGFYFRSWNAPPEIFSTHCIVNALTNPWTFGPYHTKIASVAVDKTFDLKQEILPATHVR